MKLSVAVLLVLMLSGCDHRPAMTKEDIDLQVDACKKNGAVGVIYGISGIPDEVRSVRCTFPLGDTGRTYSRPATEFLK